LFRMIYNLKYNLPAFHPASMDKILAVAKLPSESTMGLSNI